MPARATPLMQQVVDALARADEKVDGWVLAEMCGYAPPKVYPSLERLRLAGWVDFEWEAEDLELDRPRRRLYWLTEKGRGQVSDREG